MREAHELVKLGSHVVITVPMTLEGLRSLLGIRSKDGIKTFTVTFNLCQPSFSLLGSSQEVHMGSPFVTVLMISVMDGLLIQDIADIFIFMALKLKIIGG